MSEEVAVDGRMPYSVCLVAELPPPVGGMAVQAVWLTRLLKEKGHSVLNVPTNSLPLDSAWRRYPLLRGAVNFLRFCRMMWGSCANADLIHVFSNSYLSFFLFTAPVLFCARCLRKPVILHYHGGAAAAFLERWGFLARPLLRQASVVIVPSAFLRETFAEHGISVVELPNLLSDDLSFRLRQPVRPRFVMARHLEPVYNTACGVRAFRQIVDRYPDAFLVIAGGGSERGMLEGLVAKLGLNGNIRFAGPVSSDQMMALYDDADVYLNSSSVDNQPVSILEAFACGLPVVTTAAGGIPHLVCDEQDALLARVDDADDLSRQALRVLDDSSLAMRLINNGRVRSESFRGVEVYRKLFAIYSSSIRL